MRPEGDGGKGDEPGFGTLTITHDPLPTAGRPTGSTARVCGMQVVLSWWGCTGAKSCSVRRAEQSYGPYRVIPSGITDVFTFNGTALGTTGVYHHVIVAATASGTLGTLYVDGVVAGTHAQMTLTPAYLGETTQHWLGRSQHGSDPDLQGRLDDLRICSGARGPAQIAALVQA